MMRSLATVSLALLLSACGFQLRSDLALPEAMQSTFIAYEGTDIELRRTIARALLLADVNVARDETAAGAILLLPRAVTARRVLAKDIEGRPREYEVAVELEYSVVTPDGFVLVPSQQVERRGNVALDPSEPLANAGEIERAVAGLREDAVWDMLRRIAATEIPPQPVEDGTRRPVPSMEGAGEVVE